MASGPEQTEIGTSNYLVGMIDIFFALVVGQGVFVFQTAISQPFSATLQAWLAMVLIYYTVIRSFVAWHSAIEAGWYRMSSDRRTTELWRLYVDVLIVALYAYMFIAAEPLTKEEGSDLSGLFWAFPVLFALYWLWGCFRRAAWGEDDFDFRVLLLFGILYVILAAFYALLPSETLGVGEGTGNNLALAAALALMALYRYVNFWQGTSGRSMWFWKVPKPRIPPLRRPAQLEREANRE